MSTSLRVAILQFCPKIGQVQANIARARELCSKLQPRSVDLVCFPEMAFTGYVFESSAAILPYLEQPRTGPTSLFCSELAKGLQCYVVAGYPEALLPGEQCARVDSAEASNTYNLVGANSAVLYGPRGEWIGGYRKTNLFTTDLPWAKAGTGFLSFQLPPPLGKLTIGICMDLNPQTPEWSLEDGPYELADYCVSENTDILLLCNAWLDSHKAEEEQEDADLQTVRYWAARLRPLWADDYRIPDISTAPPKQASHHNTVVIACNRIGTEKDVKFAGSSTIFKLGRGYGRPVVLDMLTRNEELLQICDIRI